MDLTPALILSMWTAGIAAASALVAWWAIVGPGFSWLAAIVLVLFGVPAAAAGDEALAWLGVAAAVGAGLGARHRIAATTLFATSGVLFTAAASADSPILLAVVGALFLGGVTAEMMLGHWYLVDPRLPRWALQALALGAGAALLADVAYLVADGVLDWAPGDEVLGWAFLVLAVATAALIAGVSLALREPHYSAVMAATGLSYLAVLTAFGTSVLGRMLL
jgi:hypothetical protein